jgi:transketolase
MSATKIDEISVNTIRTLSMDAVQAANSGHPGMPMGMADAAYVLWTKFLKHNPKNPNWFDRDRFVLSAGHGSMLLYSLLHLTGYDLPLEELKNFRQLNSLTPGHPEYGLTPGVETTTGPLGQGFSTGVGMAIAEAHLAARFNKDEFDLVDHFVYSIVSDGDLMEGVTHESASLAGHLKLGKLIYLYDSNQITIDGSTELAFTEDVGKRFEAYGWHVLDVDGHNHAQIEKAIEKSQKETRKPSLIICNTTIGYGSPNKEGSSASHGAPLGEDEIRLAKIKLGMDPDHHFHIPADVLENFRQAVKEGEKREGEWNDKFEEYRSIYHEEAELFEKMLNRELPENLSELLPVFEPDEKGIATRKASQAVLDVFTETIPQLIGGSADLRASNNTGLKGKGEFQANSYISQNVNYGVREHGMGAAMNGIALHGGLIPFGGTFLIFSDYCRPAIRIAALSEIPSIFVFTHDSIGLGEDGPTHQPVEHLTALRAIPNLLVLRPADANETAWAWKVALENSHGPTALALTRQALPIFDRSDLADASGLEKGAYILKEADNGNPEVILIGTGSETGLAVEAASVLEEQDIATRVVSMPSWELFEKQSEAYRESVLPSNNNRRISVEAATTLGWQRWTGQEGVSIGLDHFGYSAPYKDVFEKVGITVERIVAEAKIMAS